ncbi:prolyl oligopeptidase family serine peptidase [Pedobacter sp. HDW13]|uniref:prolyl oligopeptidase family serine peptidase n=1 Tax=unclassified Pedobacter TaxID=2628915 RepID=UPI000F5A3D97|nr:MULTISPECIES: prolyl oligopeptidase family serine peptidase [unclassified Pedobacter]QIL38578.1 prolyl oligopeptidase family serine peptidase [Pedobacter sp. HDW13]RQO78781.1 alpha/beta hydrolase [Pedobacter sp. KBW01]
MLKNLLFLIALFVAANTFAQDTLKFEKALTVASGSRYGREAVYTDLLAWKMANQQLQAPVENGEFSTGKNGEKVLWKAIKADANGRFSAFSRRSFQTASNPFLNPGGVDRGSDYIYLTYTSGTAQTVILNVIGGNSIFFNGIPHMGDPYASGYMNIPVQLKKGVNELYVRGASVLPMIIVNAKKLLIHTDDITSPSIVLNEKNGVLKGALTISNSSLKDYNDLRFKTILNGKQREVAIARIPKLSMRKVVFEVDASAVVKPGNYNIELQLLQGNTQVDQKMIVIEALAGSSTHKQTFVSNIDGSLQYFAVTPQLNGWKPNAALFLSVHGAGVEAIGQAKAYKSKDWGTLVAATNRRPRGFNWEDWGRKDALEVLALAKNQFKPDEKQIYLTGHSMGGHGTWFLGATYPDKWAAIAPAAGYASLKDYGSADGKIPDSSQNSVERMLLRAGNQSDVPKLVSNYTPLGVYILHGDADKVVPVSYARQMKKILAGFHADFSYYEYPGGEHWFGDQSVDWPAIFSFFKWHTIAVDSAVNHIDFMTSSPGISATYRWATIEQQEQPLQYSRIILNRDRKKSSITGKTENVVTLKLALTDFGAKANVKITLDSLPAINFTTQSGNDTLFLAKNNEGWQILTSVNKRDKNPARSGTFKEAFNHKMVFVVGTSGAVGASEANLNKARYDAESWYYRGNGAVDIITDKEFSISKYQGRNIILYGNAENNTVWKTLLKDCPIQVNNSQITAGKQTWKGNDLAAYYIWPQQDNNLLVGVVASTGVAGMKAAYANQYFAGGSGFPDFMVFSSDLPKEGSKGIKLAGFYNNKWQLEEKNTAKP